MTMAKENETPDPAARPEAAYRAFLAEGLFRIQHCADCGGYTFYPRTHCKACGSGALGFVDAKGTGTVYSTTVVRQRPERGGDYNFALIELDEGPRMVSQVVGPTPEEVTIGMAVVARIEEVEGAPNVVFAPVETGGER